MIRLRSRIDARLARLRTLGVRGLFQIEQDTLRRLAKATLAATLAWLLTEGLGAPRPALASLAAILVVQVTVRASLARSIQLTIGVTVGLILSIALGTLLGLHWWTVGLIVLGGLLVGEILRLGPFAPQAAISALLAFSLGSSYGFLRVTDTIIGALVGVAVNTLISPPSYVAKSSQSLRTLAEDLGGLITDIGQGLDVHVRSTVALRWLDRARDAADEIGNIRSDLDQARESVSFNVLSRSNSAHLDRLDEARRALAHSTTQVRGITRALIDLAQEHREHDHGPDDPVRSILALFTSPMIEAAHAVAAFGRLQENPDSVPDREQARTAHERAQAGYDAVTSSLATMTTSGRLEPADALLLSSIAVDMGHLADEVSLDGTHAAAVAPSTD